MQKIDTVANNVSQGTAKRHLKELWFGAPHLRLHRFHLNHVKLIQSDGTTRLKN
jgi:hypothetical protein